MTELAPSPLVEDTPRQLARNLSRGDTVFRWVTQSSGALVLIITGSIGVFLGYQAIPTLHRYGLSFITSSVFDPSTGKVGIAAAMVGSIVIAVIALVLAFPLALATALYVSEYAPPWIKSFLTSTIDLMAALPSIIVGAMGSVFLAPHLLAVSRWLATWLGWVPIFDVPGADPRSASFPKFQFELSPFVAGAVVAIMVVPLASAVMMNVFGQAPPGEREAAYALGSTRWGMIRTVVLPFGRGGIVGGTMLGLGRALGETVAVLLVTSQDFGIKFHILQKGAVTISSLVANNFGDATHPQLQALLAAGFVLFLMTLGVNTLAAVIVGRSRSGAGVDI